MMMPKEKLRLSRVLNQYNIGARYSVPYRATLRLSRAHWPFQPLTRDKKAARARQTVYDFIRNSALVVLRNKLVNMLTLYRMKTMCNMADRPQYKDDPHRVFDWSIDEFYARCQMRNPIYVDVMLFEVPEQCLDVIKVRSDIDQMKKYIMFMFQNEDPYKFSRQSIAMEFLAPLGKLTELLKLETYLTAEIERHQRRLNRNNFQLQYFDNAINIKKEMVRVDLEKRLIDIQLTNPIEYRYLTKWIDSKREQQEILAHNEEIDYFERIQHQIYLKELSQLTTRSVLDATYTTIEVLKSKITVMQARYDKDYDEIDNKIVYLQKKIDNFVSERRFLTHEIQRFHDEIEAQQRRDEELARRKAEEEEARRAMKLLKKQNKAAAKKAKAAAKKK